MGVVYNQRELNFENYGFPGLVYDFARAGNQRDGISKRTDYIGIGRTTTGTYTNSAGIITTAAAFEPRFDYDPTTGRCNGLLIEGSSTNSIAYSSSSLGWVDPSTMVDNAGLSPDGTYTSILCTYRAYYRGTPGYTPITFSIFIKAGTSSTFNLIWAGYGGVDWTFTFSTATFTSPNGAWTNLKVETYPNGWYRLSATTTNRTLYYYLLEADSIASTFYFWGLQIENKAFPTSYIPTTTTAVTRAADNPIIISPNFYNSSTSSIILQYKPSAGIITTSQPLLSFDDNTTNNEIKVSVAGTSPTLTVVNAGVTTVSISTTPRVTIANQEYGVSLSAKDNQFTLTSEGVGIITTTTGSLPTGITTVRLGHDKAGNAFNGTISKLIYYPRDLATPALKVFSDVSYQGKIVTDGLVLNLDAGNRKSYPGSGTIWYDRAGTNNGTLTNGPTYSSSNGGSIVFDGTNDYSETTNPSNVHNQNFTLSVWVNPAVQTLALVSMIDFDHATTGSFQGWVLQSEDATTNRYFYFGWYDGSQFQPTGLGVGKGIQITTSVWQNITYTKNGTSLLGYRNGIPVYTGTASNSNVTYIAGKNLRIAKDVNAAQSRIFKGNIAQVSIYNRALTAAEVQQNYNALRSRFQ